MKICNIVAALALTSGPALAQDEMTLLLDWFVNPDHGPIIVAQEKGYFAEKDLKSSPPPIRPTRPNWSLRARRTSRFPISRNCTCKSTKACRYNGSARWSPHR